MWAENGIHPQVFADTVRHVDLMPTALDLLGVSPPEDMVGQSLRPYLTGERSYEPPLVYFEALNVYLTRDWAPLRGLVRNGYKLISLPIPELYDLERDPDEQHNIYRRERQLARRLERVLEDISSGGDVVNVNIPDLETVERLRALGYVTTPARDHKTDYTEADDPKRLIEVSNAYDEATDLFAQGQTQEALTILEGLVQKQPRSSQAYQGLAYALHQMGRRGEAIEVLERGVKSGVQDTSLLGLLSAYLLDAGRVTEARGLLEDLVRREPDYAEGHNYLGVAYGRLGLHDEARREFEKVLDLDPSSASTYNNLGSLALSRGGFEEATRLLSQALKFDPELASAHNGLGVAHARTGDVAAAIESWRRAV
ncbi:MAG: tetratricopeptide repeat protein, partial [Acidobacteriota bacterium]